MVHTLARSRLGLHKESFLTMRACQLRKNYPNSLHNLMDESLSFFSLLIFSSPSSSFLIFFLLCSLS